MAIRSDLMRPPVFVAQSLAEHKQTKASERRKTTEIDFPIYAFRSLSEEASIINCCK